MVGKTQDRLLNCKEITEEDLDKYLADQLHNNHKQCCEGGELTAGCFHDNCTGAINMNKEDEIINDVTQWACFQEVADVIGEEAAVFELEKIRLLHLEGCNELDLDLDVGKSLLRAFFWRETLQGDTFWKSINKGIVPDEYEQKPFKPTLDINEAVVNRIKETFNDSDNQDFIGNLVEKLYTSLSPSNVTISVNGNGHIIISGDKIPTVDVTKLEASEITKAYEAMVMLEGLFVGYNEKEGE